MQETSSVSFSGVFALRDGVREEEFLPRLHAFLGMTTEKSIDTFAQPIRRMAFHGPPDRAWVANEHVIQRSPRRLEIKIPSDGSHSFTNIYNGLRPVFSADTHGNVNKTLKISPCSMDNG
jgi:hypothetical protein